MFCVVNADPVSETENNAGHRRNIAVETVPVVLPRLYQLPVHRASQHRRPLFSDKRWPGSGSARDVRRQFIPSLVHFGHHPAPATLIASCQHQLNLATREMPTRQ